MKGALYPLSQLAFSCNPIGKLNQMLHFDKQNSDEIKGTITWNAENKDKYSYALSFPSSSLFEKSVKNTISTWP